VIAVAVAMQTYVKRGIQGRLHDEVTDLATQTSDLGTTKQYEPYYLDSSVAFDTQKDEKNQTGTAKNPTRNFNSIVKQGGKEIILAPEAAPVGPNK
jgi:hypothetical protein